MRGSSRLDSACDPACRRRLGWLAARPGMPALAPDLVASVATIGGVAPFDADGLDWLDGWPSENLDEFAAAKAGPAELEAFLRPAAAEMAAVTGPGRAAALGGLVPPVDPVVP